MFIYVCMYTCVLYIIIYVLVYMCMLYIYNNCVRLFGLLLIFDVITGVNEQHFRAVRQFFNLRY